MTWTKLIIRALKDPMNRTNLSKKLQVPPQQINKQVQKLIRDNQLREIPEPGKFKDLRLEVINNPLNFPQNNKR